MILGTMGAAAAAAPSFPMRWVAGAFQKMYYSDSATAATWTLAATPFSGIAKTVASNGTSLIVAAGESGQLATSPNGIDWTLQTSSFGTSIIQGVAFGNGTWVAVGDGGKLATSTDGITWTQRTSGTATQIVAIAYGNGTWAFLTSGGGISTATDPTGSWTSRTSTLTSGQQNMIYYDPTRAIWVAGSDAGTTGALASSPDAITWTSRTSALNLSNGVGMISNSTVLAFAGLLTGGSTYDVQSSTNGTTWTDRTFGNFSVYGGAVDKNDFMIFAGVRVQSSTDGTTWTDRTGALSPVLQSVCHTAGLPAIR